MKVLARAWQMLLKALEEVARAPSPIKAAEMALIRLCTVADMPTPGDLVKELTQQGDAPASSAPPSSQPSPSAPNGGGGGASALAVAASPAPRVVAETAAPVQAPKARLDHLPQDFDAVIALIREKRDGTLLYDVETSVKLVSYAPGRIEFEPAQGAPDDLATRLATALKGWTDARWLVSLSEGPGLPTISESRALTQQTLEARLSTHPLVAAAKAAFPDAEMRVIPREITTVEEHLADPEEDDDENLLGED